MAYMPAHPPGTQNKPETIPHGVKRNGSPPSGIISQHVRKHVAVLYVLNYYKEAMRIVGWGRLHLRVLRNAPA